MTAELLVFLALAGLALAGAVSLILQRHPIHSALSLIVVMAALAGLYLLLQAEFVAAIQIIVYAGAIMVLFVFVIMLLMPAPKNVPISANGSLPPACP
jgi:NADH-quinone oxidoreductase subunit J